MILGKPSEREKHKAHSHTNRQTITYMHKLIVAVRIYIYVSSNMYILPATSPSLSKKWRLSAAWNSCRSGRWYPRRPSRIPSGPVAIGTQGDPHAYPSGAVFHCWYRDHPRLYPTGTVSHSESTRASGHRQLLYPGGTQAGIAGTHSYLAVGATSASTSWVTSTQLITCTTTGPQ